MSNLLPPFHKVMSDALECHLANDRIALLEMENERLKTRVDVAETALALLETALPNDVEHAVALAADSFPPRRDSSTKI